MTRLKKIREYLSATELPIDEDVLEILENQQIRSYILELDNTVREMQALGRLGKTPEYIIKRFVLGCIEMGNYHYSKAEVHRLPGKFKLIQSFAFSEYESLREFTLDKFNYDLESGRFFPRES